MGLAGCRAKAGAGCSNCKVGGVDCKRGKGEVWYSLKGNTFGLGFVKFKSTIQLIICKEKFFRRPTFESSSFGY